MGVPRSCLNDQSAYMQNALYNHHSFNPPTFTFYGPNSMSPTSSLETVLAPQRPNLAGKTTIFLAGTTSPTGQPDWRDTLKSALEERLGGDKALDNVVLLNPMRHDWDRTWKEDFSDSRWAEQVQWELDMQDAADIVVVFFHGISPAPISLLELGICVRSRRVIACALEGYSKTGNVEAVCRRYGAVLVKTPEDLVTAVVNRLGA